MDELADLQKQLEAVQEEEPIHKFSERNIVELMEKVVEMEKLELLHSMNGKEYLTFERLGQEIQAELKKAGGRLDIIELPKLLDVSAEHIHKQIDNLIKKDKRRLFEVNDALLTNEYLNNLAIDISSLLMERGAVPIIEISSTYDLPVDFLKIKFGEWIDEQKIKGKMHGGIIYNDSYIDREKYRVRGYIMGATRPVAISQAASDLKIEEALFLNLLDEHLKSGNIKAKLQSDLVIPAFFESSQKNIVLSFYSQNHYITFSQLNKIMIRKHKEYLQGLNLDGIFLSTVFIDNAFLTTIDSAISDAVSSDNFIDLYQQVPNSFNEDDLKMLLENCSSAGKATLFGHYAASPKFIQNCFDSLKKIATEYVSKLENVKKVKKSGPSPAASKKKKKGKEEDEPEETKLVLGLNEEKALEELKKCEPIKKDRLDEDSEFLQIFIEQFYPDICQIYEDAFSEYLRIKNQPKKSEAQNLDADFQKEFDKLQSAIKSYETIEKTLEKSSNSEQKDKILTVLSTHIAKKQANIVLNYCVLQQLIYAKIDLKDFIKENTLIPSITLQEREKIIKAFPKSLQPIFTDLNKTITDRDIKLFIKTILENKAEMAVSIRPPDKKAEKVTKYTLIHQHTENIQNEQLDIKNIIYNALCVSLVENNILLYLPNENWAIEIMGNLCKIIGKANPILMEETENLKKNEEILKIEKEKRSESDIKFLAEFEGKREEKMKELKEIFKPKV